MDIELSALASVPSMTGNISNNLSHLTPLAHSNDATSEENLDEDLEDSDDATLIEIAVDDIESKPGSQSAGLLTNNNMNNNNNNSGHGTNSNNNSIIREGLSHVNDPKNKIFRWSSIM